jgi:hypothetical protein
MESPPEVPILCEASESGRTGFEVLAQDETRIDRYCSGVVFPLAGGTLSSVAVVL